MCAKLVQLGHAVDVRCAGWGTALHVACTFGHLDVVALLLDSGARVDAVDGDDKRRTPLHLAC